MGVDRPGWLDLCHTPPMQTTGRDCVLAISLAVLSIVALSSCRSEPAPNVLLVSIDTLRVDAVDQSPFLQELARTGRSFTASFASSNWTLPSHVSLLTSKPYWEHDVPPAGSEGAHAGSRIPDDVPTLASALGDAGYTTIASVEGGWVRSAFGFDQGFDVFSTLDPVAQGNTEVLEQHLDNARAALEVERGRPKFLFVHTYWAHDYFVNTPTFHDRTLADDEDWTRVGNLLSEATPEQRSTIPPAFVQRLYESGVRRADAFLRELVDLVRADPRPWLVVVTSDHGESFGERPGVWGHAHSLAPELVRVPLVAWSTRGDVLGEVDATTSAVDVAPSILRYAGAAIPRTFRGRADRFTSSQPEEEVALMRHHVPPSPRNPGGRTNQGLVTERRMLIVSTTFVGEELESQCLELGDDSSNETRAAGIDDPTCARLRDLYEALDQRLPRSGSRPPGGESTLDEEALEDLRALGYLQ